MNVAGRDADAAAAVRILAFAGRDDARTVRSDQPGFGVAGQRAFYPDHVAHRNAFGDGHDQLQPRVRAFKNRIGGERRRHEHRAGGRAGLFHGVGHGVKDRHVPAVGLEELAALAGGDAGDDLRAVIERELGVPRAEAAGDALDENLGVGFDKNGHDKKFMICRFMIYDLKDLS